MSAAGGRRRRRRTRRAHGAEPRYEGAEAFFETEAPLGGLGTELPDATEDPAAALTRLGPPPPWTVPAQLRGVLEPAYRAAASAARGLLGGRGRRRG